MIDGKTRTCGLIGDPVEHTMSPFIHNALADMLGRNLVYVPFHVEKGRLKAAVEGAYALDVTGLNVTVPYKSEVMHCLTETEPLAARIGAVNTLVRTDGGYKGYNTDMPGLRRAMECDGIRLKGEEVIVLGAGGAARAVAVMLEDCGARRVVLCNRTVERARALSEEVNRQAGRDVAEALPLSGYRQLEGRKYLGIQATSVGMYPGCGEAAVEEAAFYGLLHTGYDLIFNPASTRFMQLTEQAGGRAYNGLKMLLYQAVAAFELWNETKVPEECADEIYRRLKKEMG